MKQIVSVALWPEFSTNLQRLMDVKGYNAHRLAKALGISHVAIGNYLEGRIPQEAILIKLASLLGASPFDLLGQSGALSEASATPIPREIKPTVDRLQEIHAADPDTFNTLANVVEIVHHGRRYAERPAQKAEPEISDADITENALSGQGRIGAKLVRRELALKPKAVSHTGKTAAPLPPAPLPKDAQTHPPKPAPAGPGK